MFKYGYDVPEKPRRTYLYELEETWYQPLLARRLNLPLEPIKRSNFGYYDMAVNYLTSVLEEAKAINKVAVYNIDHMAQLVFKGKDAASLLHRTFGANILDMKIGQCKYTLLLNEKGGVQDDMIVMKLDEDKFIAVINAGHDLTDTPEEGMQHQLIADIDRIMMHKKENEDVTAYDASDKVVKIDVQGPLSFKLIKKLYGEACLKNRYQPEKNMNFFTFNTYEFEGQKYLFSRTGYTNRWGWEIYIPVEVAGEQFKRIVTEALDLGGLLVGLGGRDENRISAGAAGLPLMGQEYDSQHTPVNAPLFEAAIDMSKSDFIGKSALEAEIKAGSTKRMVLFITEGIVTGRGIYKDGKRLGTVTSSINSPNVPEEKRAFLNSARKSVLGPDGIAAIGLGWLYKSPFALDEEGKDITEINGQPVRIPVEFYREENKQPIGTPIKGYITPDGVNPATAHKALKNIENL
ncbi:MAG TPA: aminomethyltransferase family protein [Candidatus Cloacimonadota bacterium]|nr:aminomethyltransferase family protein [Candidatus Cloacimonadota bacterium]